jgi:toxin HigB-1
MLVRHADSKLARMEAEVGFTCGFGQNVVRMYRRVMQLIRDADNEQVLRNFKGLRYEKLVGDRAGQHSMRLNDQFRLIVTIEQPKPPKPASKTREDRPAPAQPKTVVIVEIVDYH